MTTIKLDTHMLQQDAGTIMKERNIQVPEATLRTLQALFLGTNADDLVHYNPPIFLPESLSIAPSDTEVAPLDITDYLGKLVRVAQHTAESHCYGSFVAGQASESDEFADVGIWLGKGNYQRNHEKDILNKLGLVAWADAEIVQMEGLYDQKQIVEGSEMGAIVKELLDSLDDCHRFFARQDSYFACCLVGQLKRRGGWCGLASIGVAS
ncbi:hypothetical protein K503DRAFT_864308 [Rhizopogon vinicolor AM-OR11-026]|uniref:Uncharacterized protein n=1 Tax=Rhizopogon vinicolor AM-OR11-026 TaxID=1314800 RepID=A0A1B7N7N1_9AGAM|nr:hypothetical protein K503DRAFT_864308 [Rhizopogon vinicolor AM-OR11-026]